MVDYGNFAERLAAHRANQDPAKRWDLYRELLTEWGYVPARKRGPLSADLMAAVGRVPPPGYDGLPGIPAALAEWMALPENVTDDGNAGGLECIWPPEWCEPGKTGGGESVPLEPGSPLAVPGSDDLRMVTFVADDQYIYEVAYRSADSVVADPMVMIYLDVDDSDDFEDDVDAADDDEGKRWVVVAPSITEFALHQAAVRLPIDRGWHATPPEDFEGEVMERVRAAWPEMGFPVGCEPIGDFMLHGGPDAIAMLADPEGSWWDYSFLLNGRTKDAVEAAAASLGGVDAPLDQWYVWEGDL